MRESRRISETKGRRRSKWGTIPSCQRTLETCQTYLEHRKTGFSVSKTRCDNDELMAKVAEMYFREGDRVADVTYGKGAFWRSIDTSQYDFYPSDLVSHENQYDFTSLPYPPESMDIVTFDPPYVTRGGNDRSPEEQPNWKYGHWITNRQQKAIATRTS